MKASFTHIIKEKGSIIAKAALLLTVVFIWILIDAGNVYGQSHSKDKDMVGALDANPMLREGIEEGEILNEPIGEPGFQIRPNPTDGDLVFDFEFIIRSGQDDTSINVFDAMGRLAYQSKLNPEVVEKGVKLDLRNQLPGTYIVVIKNGDQMFTKRFLKI